MTTPSPKETSAPRPRTELMAPAGGPDAGYAALHYGADAVYLGLKQFSARADAANFTIDEADAFTAYAHSLTPRRRVFATVNTLMLEAELHGLVELLGNLSEIGIDAVILQDLGVYRIARRHFPELRLHASTQMAVHNRAGVEELKRLGFARATLARELTLDEIRELAAIPGIETETFIHGALCYSYSGLCLFSSHAVGRSGNRGRCAYMCRDQFEGKGGRGGHVFSMKDLALPDEIAPLCDAGVSSFKIEGRMKSPLYVAATTDYYRKLIDGSLAPDERAEHEADIKSIFSRPWTPLFVRTAGEHGVIDAEVVGHRGLPIGTVDKVFFDGGRNGVKFRTGASLEVHDGLQIDLPGVAKPYGFPVDALRIHGTKEIVFEAAPGSMVEVVLPDDAPEIPPGAPIYRSSSQDVKRRYRFDTPKPGAFRNRRPLNVAIEIQPDKLTVRAGAAGTESVHELAGPFNPAKDPRKTEEAAWTAFAKLGDTRLELGKFEVRNPGGLFVPVSQLNELRRQVATEVGKRLAEKRTQKLRQIRDELRHGHAVTGTRNAAFRWSLKVDRIGSLESFEAADWNGADEIVVEIAEDSLADLEAGLKTLPRDNVRLALPMITRKWEEGDLLKKIGALQAAGWQKWEAANLSAWPLLGAQTWNLQPGTWNLSSDWSLYVTNHCAAAQILEMAATRVTLSPEDGLDNMKAILAQFGPKATVIVYQDTPLFVSESCAMSGSGDCPGKDRCSYETTELVSSHKDRVLAINRKCRTYVINRTPFCLASRLPELRDAGTVSLRADFVIRPYSPQQVRDLWRSLRSGKNPPAGHIGNFDRGLA